MDLYRITYEITRRGIGNITNLIVKNHIARIILNTN